MKRFIIVIIVMVFSLIMVLGLIGCSSEAEFESESESEAESDNNLVPTVTELYKISNPFGQRLLKSYICGNKYYYIFDLGYIENVPFNSEYYYHNGASKTEFQYKLEESSVESVQKATETTTSKLVETSNTIDQTMDLSLQAQPFDSVAVGFNAGMKNSFTYNSAVAESVTKGYRETVEKSRSVSKTFIATFDKTIPQGYWFYLLLGTLHVYGVATKDVNTGNEYTFSATSSVESSGFYMYYNNDSSILAPKSPNSQIIIDTDLFSNLPIPTEKLQLKKTDAMRITSLNTTVVQKTVQDTTFSLDKKTLLNAINMGYNKVELVVNMTIESDGYFMNLVQGELVVTISQEGTSFSVSSEKYKPGNGSSESKTMNNISIDLEDCIENNEFVLRLSNDNEFCSVFVRSLTIDYYFPAVTD